MSTAFYHFPTMGSTPPAGCTGKYLRNLILGETSTSLVNRLDSELWTHRTELYKARDELNGFFHYAAGCCRYTVECAEMYRIRSQTLDPVMSGFVAVRDFRNNNLLLTQEAVCTSLFLTSPWQMLYLRMQRGRLFGDDNYVEYAEKDGVIYLVILRQDLQVESQGVTQTLKAGVYINDQLPEGQTFANLRLYYDMEKYLELVQKVEELVSAAQQEPEEPEEPVDRYYTTATLLLSQELAGAQSLGGYVRVGGPMDPAARVQLRYIDENGDHRKSSGFLPAAACGMGTRGMYFGLDGKVVVIPANLTVAAAEASAFLGTEAESDLTIPAGTYYEAQDLAEKLTVSADYQIPMLLQLEEKGEYMTDPGYPRAEFQPLSDVPIMDMLYYCGTNTQIDGVFLGEAYWNGRLEGTGGGRFVPIGDLDPNYAMLPGVYVLTNEFSGLGAMVVTSSLDLPAGALGAGTPALTVPAGTYLFGILATGSRRVFTGLRRVVKIRDYTAADQ